MKEEFYLTPQVIANTHPLKELINDTIAPNAVIIPEEATNPLYHKQQKKIIQQQKRTLEVEFYANIYKRPKLHMHLMAKSIKPTASTTLAPSLSYLLSDIKTLKLLYTSCIRSCGEIYRNNGDIYAYLYPKTTHKISTQQNDTEIKKWLLNSYNNNHFIMNTLKYIHSFKNRLDKNKDTKTLERKELAKLDEQSRQLKCLLNQKGPLFTYGTFDMQTKHTLNIAERSISEILHIIKQLGRYIAMQLSMAHLANTYYKYLAEKGTYTKFLNVKLPLLLKHINQITPLREQTMQWKKHEIYRQENAQVYFKTFNFNERTINFKSTNYVDREIDEIFTLIKQKSQSDKTKLI